MVAFAFHVLTDASLAIGLYPHLIALLAFCPLERVPPRVLAPVRRYRHMTARAPFGAQGRIGTSTG